MANKSPFCVKEPNVCIVTDFEYLTRTILLLESLLKYEPAATVYILAFDEQSFRTLTAANRSSWRVFRLNEIETPELTAARKGRNWIEWVWLFQPAFPLYLMEKAGTDHIFWMDGDMWAFGSLTEMFAEIGEADVAVSPHRFPPHRSGSADTVSIFNGGATYFRNTERGRACCRQWLADCIEWDYWWSASKPGPKPGQKGGTQGYLDFWPEQWGARIVEHLGCNLAPWNQDHPDYEYSLADDGKITICGQPLLFYHFQDFKPQRGFIAGPEIIPFVVENIYMPYAYEYALKQRLWQPQKEAKDVSRLAA